MYLKSSIGAVAFVLALFSLAFQGKQAAPAGPKMVIPETEYNLGEVKAGEEVKHTFVFRNEGKADLVIQNVSPVCGCTATDFSQLVPPGQEGRITLAVKTGEFKGPVSSSAEVTTNDPQLKTFNLTLRMTVQAAPEPK